MNTLKSIDDFVLDSVNSGVKSYNYVTGRDKYQMADDLMNAAITIECLGYAMNGSLLSVGVCIPIFAIATYFQKKEIELMSMRDDIAKKKMCLDGAVEKMKPKFKMDGYMWLGMGTFDSLSSNYSYNVIGAGHLLRSMSDFTLLCDNYPKKKNCVKRASEYISKKINQIPIPKPAFVSNYVYGLSKYL